MAVEIIGSSGNIADVDASGNVKVNVEASTAVPVSGTVAVSNFPATQPVSAAILPLPSGAATSAKQPALGTAGTPATDVLSVQGVAGGTPQPVSGTVAVSNFPATQPVSAVSLPLPANAAQETGGNLAAIVTNTSTIATNTANETSGAQKSQLNDPTSFVGANVVAKAVQAANALGAQDLKDSGRSKVILSSVKVTSVTTEALLTLTQKKGDATVTTGTSYTVTAGKTLRIQSIKLYAEMTTAATAAWVSCRLREGAASGGAVSATSDIVAIIESNTIAVTDVIGMGVPPAIVSFPDGLEIAGGQTLGISELALNADLSVTIVVIGFEY